MFVFLAFVLLGCSTCDEITTLPGWHGALPSRMYSGYLNAGDPQYKMFYWFAESENAPKTDPVVLWVNGGPGASSINDGLLAENGPFEMNTSASPRAPQLQLRPHRWTKRASVLFWESPPGVGFSYCAGGSCPEWNDTSTADANHGFLCSFFEAFPQFKANPFYITGESYGGVYVPTLAYNIMTKPLCTIRLMGIAVGNGCTGNGWGTTCSGDMMKYGLQVLRDRTMLPDELYRDVLTQCQDPKYPDRLAWDNTATVGCQQAVIAASDAVGHFNIYNIYDTCPTGRGTFLSRLCTGRSQGHMRVHWACNHSSNAAEQQHGTGSGMELWSAARKYSQNITRTSAAAPPPNAGATGCLRCVGSLATTWLKQDSVQKALHAAHPWGTQKFDYLRNLQKTLPMIKELVKKYKVWFYTGDEDTCVPYPGTQLFLSQTGFPVKNRWSPWLLSTTGNPVGGYFVEYEVDGPGFRWLTIKDSGHLVPHYTPLAAYDLLSQLLGQKP